MKEFRHFGWTGSTSVYGAASMAPEEQRILLTPKAFSVLRYLLERAGRLVTQDELLEALSKGELAPARIEAEQFVKAAMAIPERTFRALAFEANARLALAERELARAKDCIARAVKEMEGFETPLTAWRVHATATELYQHMGEPDVAEGHRELSRSTIMKVANSLSADEPLRKTFLSAPVVQEILRSGAFTLANRST